MMRAQDFDPVLPGGRFVDPATSFGFLVAFAYDIENPDSRLLGLPTWAWKPYAVTARAADDFPVLSLSENLQRVRLMLRQMLTDRFGLHLHTENRRETVLKMQVEKGGLLLKEVAAPIPPEREGRVNVALGDDGGRLIANKATVASLAKVIALFLGQNVIDETGLTGYYDYDIRWTAQVEPGSPRPSSRLGADGMALFLSTLKDRFGLTFSRDTGPVQYWIIDQAQLPTED